MALHGKTQLMFLITAPAELADEGRRLFASHEPWMRGSHPRSGDTALLAYDVAISPELSDPMDGDSAPTGNTNFILLEVYETPAGVANHFKLGEETWNEFGAFMEWMGKCKTSPVTAANIEHSLW